MKIIFIKAIIRINFILFFSSTDQSTKGFKINGKFDTHTFEAFMSLSDAHKKDIGLEFLSFVYMLSVDTLYIEKDLDFLNMVKLVTQMREMIDTNGFVVYNDVGWEKVDFHM